MYKLFYGLAEAPFNLTPDSKFLYLSRRHHEALTALKYGVSERKGFICITGEIGSGKTTTLRALMAQLDEDKYSVATILNSYLTDLELLKTINEEFGLSGESNSKKALLDELNAFLVSQYQQGRNCVLILDESQNLRPETLEQIRMISNLETETDKLIQIVLVGQPELRRTLELPELEQLNQRITVRYHVGPLDLDEVAEYINHRLRVAKAQEKIEFTPQAIRLIYHYSKGIPRRINVICDRCLLVGYVLARFDIDGDMVQQAVDEIRGVSQPKRPEVAAIQQTEQPRRRLMPTRQALIMGLAGIGVVSMGFFAGAAFRSWTRPDRAPVAAAAPAPAASVSSPVSPIEPLPPVAAEPSSDMDLGGTAPGSGEAVAAIPIEATPEATATKRPDPAKTASPRRSPTPPAAKPVKAQAKENQVAAPSATPSPTPLAMPGPATAPADLSPAAWMPDAKGILRVDRPELALPAAYLQMLRQWGIEVDLEPFAQAPPEEVALYDMKAMVGQLDFRTYSSEVLDSVLKLDLPIVIRNKTGAEGAAPVASVIGRNAEMVKVADPKSGLREVKLSDLQKQVVEATVLYHDPDQLTGLKSGDEGAPVKALQRTLAALGVHKGEVDGIFGPEVRQSLRNFQKAEGLSASGRVDPATAATICSRADSGRPRLSS